MSGGAHRAGHLLLRGGFRCAGEEKGSLLVSFHDSRAITHMFFFWLPTMVLKLFT